MQRCTQQPGRCPHQNRPVGEVCPASLLMPTPLPAKLTCEQVILICSFSSHSRRKSIITCRAASISLKLHVILRLRCQRSRYVPLTTQPGRMLQRAPTASSWRLHAAQIYAGHEAHLGLVVYCQNHFCASCILKCLHEQPMPFRTPLPDSWLALKSLFRCSTDVHLYLMDDHWLVGEVHNRLGHRQCQRAEPRSIPANKNQGFHGG